MDIDPIYERFQKAIGVKRDDLVAKEIGISKQSLGGFKTRGKLPFEAMIDYCKKHKIDINFIFFGNDPGEEINEELKLENERLKAKLEIVRELLMQAIGKDK
jgi:hypothetical protein